MSNSENRITLNRREALFLAAAGGIGAALARPAYASDSTKTTAHQEPGICSTPRSAVANTQYGKVRGFVSGDVFTFKGVPYGQDTSGENRWLPAKPPKPWTGEYPALIYGANCPQHVHDNSGLEQSFLQDWDDGYMNEDMLKLNIWTPSLTGKLPVMFYIHGGGYLLGSAYELPSHEGAQMARHHDVVQVSVNHRLNILGFFDVSEIGGSAYEDSANLGMTDLVAALQWVRDNISNFGGDPDRVMIYGQSGGGSKVTNLLGMPSAKGLIHRASAQSGGGGDLPSAEETREYTRQLIKEMGIAPHDIGALQKMEWSKMMDAVNSLAAKSKASGPMLNLPFFPIPAYVLTRFWGPTLDGRVITMKSFHDAAPEISKDVPMLIGSVSEEGTAYASKPTEAEWHAGLAKFYGEAKATALIAAMKKAHPEKSIQTLSYGVAGLNSRTSVTRMAKMKYDLRAAPVYTYYFCWQTPMLEGPGAWHTAELQFCFDNTLRCAQGTGNTPEAQALAKKMATAWANFARTGNPSQPGLTWEPSDPVRNQTMVWDNQCRMVDDPEGEARKILLG
jgi:para-nitrobenzyl esterase